MTNQDLAALLTAARNEGELSYEKLSIRCGGSPSAKRLQQLVTRPLKNFPDPDTITHLARGTGQSVTTIILASARSLGLQVASEDSDQLRIAGLRQLPPALLEAYQVLGEQITRSLAEAGDGDAEAAPMNRAGESPAPKDVLVPDDPTADGDQAQLDRRVRRALLQLDSIDLATAGTDKRAEYNAKHALSYSSRVLADVDPLHRLHDYPVYANMHSVPEEALEDDWTIESFHEGLNYALERLRAGEKGDELARRRRERGGLEVVPPRPDEDTMAAYDEPQQSILERDQQDADAEGSQVPPEED